MTSLIVQLNNMSPFFFVCKLCVKDNKKAGYIQKNKISELKKHYLFHVWHHRKLAFIDNTKEDKDTKCLEIFLHI